VCNYFDAFVKAEPWKLAGLPPGRFELFSEARRTVDRDGHVQVNGAYYSVPPEYLGQNLWANNRYRGEHRQRQNHDPNRELNLYYPQGVDRPLVAI
jgi:hypothetical protein